MKGLIIPIAALLSAALISMAPAKTEPSDINNMTNKTANVEQPRKVVAQEVAPLQEKTPEPPASLSEPVAPKEKVVTKHKQVSQGCETYRSILDDYSWNVEVAIAVCNAESSGDPSNENPTDKHGTCRGSRGLFQIGCDSTNNYAGMHDPAANIAQAYALYSRRGWQPWSSTTCRVKVRCY